MAHAENTTEEHHGAAHSDSHYVKIWGLLLVLLVISIAAAIPMISEVLPSGLEIFVPSWPPAYWFICCISSDST